MNGTKAAGLGCVVVGLILLAMCLLQWTPGTGSAAGQAVSAYNSGDVGTLASINREFNLNDTSRTVMEGIAGLFWVGIGALLLKKAGGAAVGGKRYQRMPPPRR